MRYTGKYFILFTSLLRKYLNEQYGKRLTKKVIREAKPIYRNMIEKCEDIGFDNPMAKNIYMCFVFLAIWEAADGEIDINGYRVVIKNLLTSSFAQKFVGGRDLNKPEDLQKAKEKFHKMQAWADEHPEYKDKTWDFNFDESKHKDGTYYHFTRCPIEAFARKNGYLDVLPICCEIDYYMTAANHGVLHRDYTLATGGDICDYWIVPDQIRDPQ